MREDALRSILLVKAVEEADREGTLLPAADRAAATRDAVRERGESTAAADTALPAGLLPTRAADLLAARAGSNEPGWRPAFPSSTRCSPSEAESGGSAPYSSR
jgi:hypothetical protein